MSRRRFYAPPSDFDFDGMRVRLDAEEARHLTDVLRLGRGDEAFVFDGQGREFRCRLTQARRHEAVLEIEEEVEATAAGSPLHLTLGVALLKGEKFDLVVQKATELGATRILPVVTKFADVRIKGDGEERRVARWKRIALEAAKQSGRASLPDIPGPEPFASVIESKSPESGACRLFFSERGGSGLLEAIKECRAQEPVKVTALVGPEGGWADEELDGARRHRWHIVTLGGRTLRAETAAIVVTALLEHLCGDVR